MVNMGLDFGLESNTTCFKTKFRWLFKIPYICAYGITSLPPVKSARPQVSFKEIQAEHINETIYYPGKPDWKPLNLVVYDLKRNMHPIFSWLQLLYNPNNDLANYSPPIDKGFILKGELELYDPCGQVIESWIYDNIWPQTIDFGELAMGTSEIVTCDLTLRYARAYLNDQSNNLAQI